MPSKQGRLLLPSLKIGKATRHLKDHLEGRWEQNEVHFLLHLLQIQILAYQKLVHMHLQHLLIVLVLSLKDQLLEPHLEIEQE